jgi:hypothetical protein
MRHPGRTPEPGPLSRFPRPAGPIIVIGPLPGSAPQASSRCDSRVHRGGSSGSSAAEPDAASARHTGQSPVQTRAHAVGQTAERGGAAVPGTVSKVDILHRGSFENRPGVACGPHRAPPPAKDSGVNEQKLWSGAALNATAPRVNCRRRRVVRSFGCRTATPGRRSSGKIARRTARYRTTRRRYLAARPTISIRPIDD